ncbi:MAG: glycosyltransferase, partial [Proteobacteria bacterium]|nr:glycosyltransferase [Pseudomonadota bacterium]
EILNSGQRIPAEILICIPQAEVRNVEYLATIKNVNVITTAGRGQVAQRAVGLEAAKCDYVLQCDDDVILSSHTMHALLNFLVVKGRHNVVAPFFKIYPGGQDSTIYSGNLRDFFRDCYFTLVCGAAFGRQRFGRIASAGIGFGVVRNDMGSRVVESEWLPGGVALCHRSDLITYNYYPFSGKAVSEDLIHSLLWRDQGCRLWTMLDESAMVDVSTESYTWEGVMGRYRAHTYVAKLMGAGVLRTRLWFSSYCLLNLRKIFSDNFCKSKNSQMPHER